MGSINLEDVKPGMVLARDAKDLSGRVLLAAGHEITEKHLRVFKIWGVSEADIQGLDQEEIAAETISQTDPEVLKRAEQRVAELFAHTDQTHPAIAELKRLIVFRFINQESGKEVDGE